MTYSIGDLARRTGLTVKTVRYYSDRGLLSPVSRSPAGHRLYGDQEIERLELISALRALDFKLDVIQQVLDRELPLDEVAAAQVEAIIAQIRELQTRRAVLTVAARYGIPVLPPESATDQLAAWREVVMLCQDADFQKLLSRLAEAYDGRPVKPDIVARAQEALAHGVAPGGLEVSDDPAELIEVLTAAMDPRWARYRELVAVVNGWDPPEDLVPLCEWVIASLRSTGVRGVPAAADG